NPLRWRLSREPLRPRGGASGRERGTRGGQGAGSQSARVTDDDAIDDLPEVHAEQVRVRWRDTDAIGHVNHTAFITYMEEARDAWFMRRLGKREVYIIVRIEIDFVQELPRDVRDVTVHVKLEGLGGKSIRTREEISADGVVFSRARSILVRFDLPSGQTLEITDAERELLSLPASVDS